MAGKPRASPSRNGSWTIFWCSRRCGPSCAVKAVNEVSSALRLEKHPDKTFIGKIERGFDFLGYRFGAAVLATGASDNREICRTGNPAS
jgi:hypothetical protein